MGFLDPKALRDWIKSRAVNNLMATAKGFFLDARVGPVIQEKIDEVKEEVDEINGNLKQATDGRFVLPNGLVIQWGIIFATEGKAEIHFPIHYRNIPVIMANCEWGDNTNALVANAKYVTSSGAALSVSVLTGQQIIGAGGNNVHWMSIGY